MGLRNSFRRIAGTDLEMSSNFFDLEKRSTNVFILSKTLIMREDLMDLMINVGNDFYFFVFQIKLYISYEN